MRLMSLPEKTYLPFFTYGLFKHDQLCHSIIKKFVNSFKEERIKGYLKERDGVPLLILAKENNYNSYVKGNMLFFNQGDEKRAYDEITKIESSAL